MADSIGNRNLQVHLVNQLQAGFELNPEIYNLSTSGMELIGFSSKNLNQENSSVFWKGCSSNKPGNHVGFSWKGIDGPAGSSSESYKHDGLTGIADSSMVSPENNSFVDFSSLRCVFPFEGNERPSKGLSLSLNPSNPSSIGLRYSYQLVQEANLRFDPSSSRSVTIDHRQQQYTMQENSHEFGNSKFLGPTQELLNEFCNLGTNKTDHSSKQKIQKTSERQDEIIDMSKQSLHALDHLELQNRTTKLLQMLEEVDRRYKHYCDQMKAVVSSFEAVAGNGAAIVYSALASRAMSKHFRCLKDGILSQMKATEKAMGDKDSAVTGTSKGETPRLRLLDQALRQQRAFQQTRMMENHPWRPQRGLPERSVSVLRAWLFEHFLHPYPSDIDKHTLARQTGLSRSQVSNWFINARVRLWKPMVEEMYLEEFKDQHDGVTAAADRNNEFLNQNLTRNEDQKPTHDQLVRIHSESPSSILNNPEENGGKRKKTLENEVKNHCFGGVGDSFGAIELDFSSYPCDPSAAAGGGITPTVSYGGGGVSLTLGLYQHGLQGSLFYHPRYDHMEDSQTVQYSILEGENQNLPYCRNVMGSQLLHDLAG